ncbi:MAG: hypothetical protein C5B54_04705 [Acidobacteria bacterium]|nr:MAG: hypothetical protein C5B54_04705 [Acidobacteriota bacterium]
MRLRPHVVNSLISEIASTAEQAEVGYRQSRVRNLELSARYLIQRGIPRGAMFVEYNPWHFNVTLDPPHTRYNNYCTLTCIPQFLEADTIQNRGYVRMNVNNLGYVPLLRNDGYELRAGDLLPGKPFLCAFFNGAWYHLGLVASQVPLVMVGAIDFWIRTDGNDETGDGTANRPDKAFRTINGCWYAVGSRYAGSPSAHIAMRLGIPGNYEAGSIGPFGATVSLTGDIHNRAAYRIMDSEWTHPGGSGVSSLRVGGVNLCILRGINIVNTNPRPVPGMTGVLWPTSSSVMCDRIQLTNEASNGSVIMIHAQASQIGNGDTYLGTSLGESIVEGNGTTMAFGFRAAHACQCCVAAVEPGRPFTWHWRNCNFIGAGHAAIGNSSVQMQNTVTTVTNCSGPRYSAADGSFVFLAGSAPGNQPGSVGSFSMAYPQGG